MFSNDSTPKLIFTLIVYVTFFCLLFLYLIGLTGKDGIFGFLHHTATVGDVIVIVGAGIFIVDDMSDTRIDIVNKNIQISVEHIENVIRERFK